MSNLHTTTITETDRVDWLLRHGSAMQVNGRRIQSREQVDEQIRKARLQIGRSWNKTLAEQDASAQEERHEDISEPTTRMDVLTRTALLARSAELGMISAANRELAVFIGDLRLRRCS